MTDHKYTDDEVIRALDHCRNGERGSKCSKCEYITGCKTWLIGLALDLINRQRAEIDDLTRDTIPKLQNGLERANKYGMELEKELANAKAEAIKKFAERLKERHYFHASCIGNCYQMYGNDIDTLVKEMARRCPDCKHFVGCEAACGGVPCDEYTKGDTNAE